MHRRLLALGELSGRFDITDATDSGLGAGYYRARERHSKRRVLLFSPDAASAAAQARATNYLDTCKNLAASFVLPVLELRLLDGGPLVVLEERGQLTLRQFAQRQLPQAGGLDRCLRALQLSLKLAQALRELEQHGVVHNALQPDSVWLDWSGSSLQLSDFAYASRAGQPAAHWIGAADRRDGVFLAPELRDGEVSLACAQSDQYALGALLIYLLDSTKVPNTAGAQVPQFTNDAVARCLGDVGLDLLCSEALSELLTILIQQRPHDRYANSASLIHALKHCISCLESVRVRGMSTQKPMSATRVFKISDTLVGRDNELQQMLDVYAAATAECAQATQLRSVQLVGGAGMGKSALVRRFLQDTVPLGAMVLQARYGKNRSDEPLSAIVEALESALQQILRQPEAARADWREKITAALQHQGAALQHLLPSLQTLIGEQPALADIVGKMATQRLYAVLARLIGALHSAGTPLIFCLDDLHWADGSSLRFLQYLYRVETAPMVLLLAFRSPRGGEEGQWADCFSTDQARHLRLELQPLSKANLYSVVAASLECSKAKGGPLADLLFEKTAGDPFYTQQLLGALHAAGHIAYAPQDRCWSCDLSAVRRATLSDNVVSFMSQRLRELPADALEVLRVIACLGERTDLPTLAQAMDKDQLQVARLLWQGLESGLVVLDQDIYKFQSSANDDDTMDEFSVLYGEGLQYCLLHDRVRQAAQHTIPATDLACFHQRLGQRLLAQYLDADDDRSLFDMLDKLNSGLPYLRSDQERQAMAALYHQAGLKSRVYLAYDESLSYLKRGIHVIGEQAWELDRQTCVNLYLEAATSALLASKFNDAFDLLDSVEPHLSGGVFEVLQHAILKVQLCCLVNKLDTALEVGYSSLKKSGLWPQRTTAETDVQVLLERVVIERQPPPQEELGLVLLLCMTPAAFYTKAQAYRELVSTQMHFCCEYSAGGIAVMALYNYGTLFFGAQQARADRILAAVEERRRQLSEASTQCRLDVLDMSLSAHRRQALTQVVAQGESLVQRCIDTGDYTFAAYAAMFSVEKSFFCSDNLQRLGQQSGEYAQFSGRVLHQVPHYQLSLWQQLLQNLRLGGPQPDELSGPAFSERDALPLLESNHNEMILFYLYLGKALLALHFDKLERAAGFIVEAERSEQACSATYCGSVLPVLAVLVAHRRGDQSGLSSAVRRYRLKVSAECSLAQQNFAHYEQLIEGLVADQERRFACAEAQLLAAVDTAERNAMTHDALLIQEQLLYFYQRQNKAAQAGLVLRRCIEGYKRWGADAKAEHLESRCERMLDA